MTHPLTPKKRKPQIFGQAGDLIVRLAENQSELRAAQKLRYKVFCDEKSAKSSVIEKITKRESDEYDRKFDHLLVIDKHSTSNLGIVGTQRLTTADAEGEKPDFYSQNEFEISSLLSRHPRRRFMELGRSCILPEYRNKRTMELMWHGTWDYALQTKADVMFGCASFYAVDIRKISEPLRFLRQIAPTHGNWNASSNLLDAVSIDELADQVIDQKAALKSLPTLIKAYLRLGARFGSHAVIDKNFGTIDVLVVLPIENINEKYVSYYGKTADRHRAAA